MKGDLFHQETRYVLDANAFIEGHRRYYGLDFCPGYWDALVAQHQAGKLCSIDRVREELEQGGDALWQWAGDKLGAGAFASTADSEVAAAYAETLAWVMAQPQFNDAATSEYQSVADGWLVAYAKAHGGVVVTLEVYDANVKKRVPLPNVCKAFDVEWITPFEMLRRLEIKLVYERKGKR
jgi:hypothetical protein